MNKILSVILFLPLLTIAQLQKTYGVNQNNYKGIRFEENLTWEQVKAIAKSQNKYIFVDCYATWCGPCKLMDKEVYINDTVGNYMNARFISIKIQFDRTANDDVNVKNWYNDAEQLNKEYKIRSYPSYLFFSPDGNIVHRASGYLAPTNLITLASKALNPQQQYYSLLENYKRGLLDYQFLPYLLDMVTKLGETSLSNSLKSDYLVFLAKEQLDELYTTERLAFIASVINDSKSKFFPMFYPNGEKANKTIGRANFARTVTDSIIYRELIHPELIATPTGKEPNWKKLLSLINKKYNKQYANRMISFTKYRWYENINYKSESWKYFVELVEENGIDTSYQLNEGWLNSVAWNIFGHSNDTSQIYAALKWMEGVVRRQAADPEDAYIDTYANLLYKVGRNDAAIYWETKALNLAKLHLDSMRVKFYQETIEYIHMGKPTWAVSKIKKIDTSKVSGNGNNTVISGVWVIKSRDLISGTLYANAVPITMKLSLKPESLQIEQTSIGEGGTNNNIIYELSLSGTPLPSITKSNRKKVQQLSWIDKKKTMFRINTVLSAPNNDKEVESRNEELLSLSSDGQQLTILKKSKSVKSDSWEIKAVYERQ